MTCPSASCSNLTGTPSVLAIVGESWKRFKVGNKDDTFIGNKSSIKGALHYYVLISCKDTITTRYELRGSQSLFVRTASMSSGKVAITEGCKVFHPRAKPRSALVLELVPVELHTLYQRIFPSQQ